MGDIFRVKFFHDKNKAKEIEQKLMAKWDRDRKPRTGIHTYDVVYCQLKAFLRFAGVEKRITKQSVGFMVFGIIGDFLVGELFPRKYRHFKTGLYDVIKSEIDVLEQGLYPLEIKTTRKRIFRKSQVPQKWVEQLLTYMCEQNAHQGWLVLLSIFSGQIMTFKLEITQQEIEAQKVVALERARIIKEAVNNRDPTPLQPQPAEYSLCDYKYRCPKKEECREKAKNLGKKR